MKRIVVIGAGAFGTALSIVFLKSGHHVTLKPRRQKHADEMLLALENTAYLPGVPLPNNLIIDASVDCLTTADLVILAMPVQQTPTVLKELSPYFPKKIPIIIVSKGILIESATDFPFLSGWIDNFIPGHPVFVLSGPNLAGEIAKGLPAAATLAFPDAALAQEMAKSLWHTQFRLYPSTDRFGVEFCGAVKNVYAIACGICVGMSLGQNALASLMTRSLAEMKRLGLAMGADIETFLGLAGVGDLMLTCTSIQSRNMSFGMELANGNSVAEISAHRHTIAEGVATSKALNQIIKAKNLAMPIADAIFAIVHQGANVETVILELLNRKSNQFESF